MEVRMKRLLWAVLVAALAVTGCDNKKKGPDNAPAPKVSAAQTNEAMRAVAAQSPASDPSLPSAETALAAHGAAAGTTVR
jgi:hypothetical protein